MPHSAALTLCVRLWGHCSNHGTLPQGLWYLHHEARSRRQPHGETFTLTALQQSLVSVTFLFVALGSIVAGPTGHYLGRRGTIQVGCGFVAIGAGGMLGTTGSYLSYMVCKCIGGVSLGFFNAAAPAYGVECTTPSKRGMLTSLFGLGLGIGTMLAAVGGRSNDISGITAIPADQRKRKSS